MRFIGILAIEEESAVRRTAGLAVWMSGGGGAIGVTAMTLTAMIATPDTA
jgi:hypothetical protein